MQFIAFFAILINARLFSVADDAPPPVIPLDGLPPKRYQTELKGLRDDDAHRRATVGPMIECRRIVREHQAYYKEYESVKAYAGEMMAYVVRKSPMGYKWTRTFAQKLNYVAPVWFNIVRNFETGQLEIDGTVTGKKREWMGQVRVNSLGPSANSSNNAADAAGDTTEADGVGTEAEDASSGAMECSEEAGTCSMPAEMAVGDYRAKIVPVVDVTSVLTVDMPPAEMDEIAALLAESFLENKFDGFVLEADAGNQEGKFKEREWFDPVKALVKAVKDALLKASEGTDQAFTGAPLLLLQVHPYHPHHGYSIYPQQYSDETVAVTGTQLQELVEQGVDRFSLLALNYSTPLNYRITGAKWANPSGPIQWAYDNVRALTQDLAYHTLLNKIIVTFPLGGNEMGYYRSADEVLDMCRKYKTKVTTRYDYEIQETAYFWYDPSIRKQRKLTAASMYSLHKRLELFGPNSTDMDARVAGMGLHHFGDLLPYFTDLL